MILTPHLTTITTVLLLSAIATNLLVLWIITLIVLVICVATIAVFIFKPAKNEEDSDEVIEDSYLAEIYKKNTGKIG